jgi:hypothetical protein
MGQLRKIPQYATEGARPLRKRSLAASREGETGKESAGGAVAS